MFATVLSMFSSCQKHARQECVIGVCVSRDGLAPASASHPGTAEGLQP